MSPQANQMHKIFQRKIKHKNECVIFYFNILSQKEIKTKLLKLWISHFVFHFLTLNLHIHVLFL